MNAMNEIEKARHATQRGMIIACLREDFRSAMTTVGSIQSAMDMLGHPMSAESIAFHLEYLSTSGYLRIFRVRDMPGWRVDRPSVENPDAVKFAKLLPKGLQLLDGAIDADPLVRFA